MKLLLCVLAVVSLALAVEPYKILGVKETATLQQLDQAYNSLKKKYKKNAHMRTIVDEAYQQLIAQWSDEDLAAQAQAEMPQTTTTYTPHRKKYAVGGMFGRRRFGKVMGNLARQMAAPSPPRDPGAARRQLTPTQVQNIQTAKSVAGVLNFLIKLVPFVILWWCCIRPRGVPLQEKKEGKSR